MTRRGLTPATGIFFLGMVGNCSLVLANNFVSVAGTKGPPHLVSIDAFGDEARRAIGQGHNAATRVMAAERDLKFGLRSSMIGRIVAASQTLGKVRRTGGASAKAGTELRMG